jgi:hypothetical protein
MDHIRLLFLYVCLREGVSDVHKRLHASCTPKWTRALFYICAFVGKSEEN